MVAASVDSKEDAKKVVRELHLSFPVAYGIDALHLARTYGCFYDEADRFLHATGFVLRPGGTIEVAAYSTGPIGRLTASDCLSLIEFRKKRSQ